MQFYIFSLERKLWWRKDNYGYTSDLSMARLFTLDEAEQMTRQVGAVKYKKVEVTDSSTIADCQEQAKR